MSKELETKVEEKRAEEAQGEAGRRTFTPPAIREHGELAGVTGYFGLFITTPFPP